MIPLKAVFLTAEPVWEGLVLLDVVELAPPLGLAVEAAGAVPLEPAPAPPVPVAPAAPVPTAPEGEGRIEAVTRPEAAAEGF